MYRNLNQILRYLYIVFVISISCIVFVSLSSSEIVPMLAILYTQVMGSCIGIVLLVFMIFYLDFGDPVRNFFFPYALYVLPILFFLFIIHFGMPLHPALFYEAIGNRSLAYLLYYFLGLVLKKLIPRKKREDFLDKERSSRTIFSLFPKDETRDQ